jgi:hypothetical protein
LHALIQTLPADQAEPVSICGSEFWSHDGLTSALKLLEPADRARFRLIPAGSLGAAFTLANRSYTALGYWKPSAQQRPVVETRGFGQVISTVYVRNVR